jgi:hypothetical protein
MPRREKQAQPDVAWQTFERLHPGQPFLAQDPLYALTEDAIDAIQKGVPGFFTDEQVRFERDLYRMTGGGFFLRRPLGEPASLRDTPGLTVEEFLMHSAYVRPTPGELEKRLAPILREELRPGGKTDQVTRIVNDFLAEFREWQGRSRWDIREAGQQERREGRFMLRRGEAYAGWLILNRQFRQELDGLRARWETAVSRRGSFPEPVGPDGPGRKGDSCTRECRAFYRRWCLERMLTWELPVPLAARLHPAGNPGSGLTGEEGVNLLLPWYLVRGEQLDVHQVLQRIRFESAPEHLRGWVCKPRGRTGPAGEVTYQRLYWLYRCYELVLGRRYAAACPGRLEKLDTALASVVGLDQDWVKRLRQRLAREVGKRAKGSSDGSGA